MNQITFFVSQYKKNESLIPKVKILIILTIEFRLSQQGAPLIKITLKLLLSFIFRMIYFKKYICAGRSTCKTAQIKSNF